MKKGILSLIVVFLALAITANAMTTSDSLYISTDEAYDTNEVALNTTGIVTVTDSGLTSDLAVSYASTNLTLDGDDDVTIELLSGTSTLTYKNGTSTLKISPKWKTNDDTLAGNYEGTIDILNSSNKEKLFSVPVTVLVPAIEISSIEVLNEDGSKDTKWEKGQKVTIKVNYKNIADESKLENLELTVGVYEGDSGDLQTLLENDDDELEDDSDDLSDLSAGKSGSKEFTFEIPYDIEDEDEFTVLAEITADGKDNEGSFYARDTKDGIKATVEDDKVAITRFVMSPSTIDCGADADNVKVSYSLMNIGGDDQDIEVFLRSSAIGFEKMLNDEEEVELGNDYEDEDDYSTDLSEYVDLKGLKTGSNVFTLTLYYNDVTTTEEFTVVKSSCDATSVNTNANTTSSTSTPVVVQTPVESTTSQPATTANVPATTTSYVTLKDVSGGVSGWVVPTVIGVGALLVGVLVAILLMPRA